MHFLKNFYYKILRYDLINKFIYNNTNNLPKLEKIVLSFGFSKNDIKQFATGLLAFELISNQKGILTITKKPNIVLKIRKGNPIGCKVTLQNQNLFNFFGKMLLRIFPMLKTFNEFKLTRKFKINRFSYEIHETFSFFELENHYYYFSNLPKLSITLITTAKNKKELLFILNSFQFPLKKNN